MVLNAERRRCVHVDCRQWFQTLLTTTMISAAAAVVGGRDRGPRRVVTDVLPSTDRRRRSLLPVVAVQDSLTSLGQIDEARTAAGCRRRGRGTTGRPGTLIHRGGSQHQVVRRTGLADARDARWWDWVGNSRVVGPVLDQGAWLTPCCDHPLL